MAIILYELILGAGGGGISDIIKKYIPCILSVWAPQIIQNPKIEQTPHCFGSLSNWISNFLAKGTICFSTFAHTLSAEAQNPYTNRLQQVKLCVVSNVFLAFLWILAESSVTLPPSPSLPRGTVLVTPLVVPNVLTATWQINTVKGAIHLVQEQSEIMWKCQTHTRVHLCCVHLTLCAGPDIRTKLSGGIRCD